MKIIFLSVKLGGLWYTLLPPNFTYKVVPSIVVVIVDNEDINIVKFLKVEKY